MTDELERVLSPGAVHQKVDQPRHLHACKQEYSERHAHSHKTIITQRTILSLDERDDAPAEREPARDDRRRGRRQEVERARLREVRGDDDVEQVPAVVRELPREHRA